MLLNPNNEITELLEEVGLTEVAKKDISAVTKILNENGLSLEDLVNDAAVLARSTNHDSIKLDILKTALKMHGALEEQKKQKTQIPAINITVQNFNGDTQNVLNLLTPGN
jgi:hypothetical protein